MSLGPSALLAFLVIASAQSSHAVRPGAGSFAGFGTHRFYAYDPGQSEWGANAILLIRPESMRPLSRRLASSGLGFLVRWNRVHLRDAARLEGVELALRHYLNRGGEGWHPFIGGGLGRYAIDWDASDARRTSWSAAVEGGVERQLSPRWLIAIALHNRFIEEFSGSSYSGSSLIATLALRIDP